MVICHPTTKGLAQFLGRSLDPTIRQRCQLDWIGLKSMMVLQPEHRATSLPKAVLPAWPGSSRHAPCPHFF